jgi:chromosomal replication initiation ATPase DnaA
MTRPSKREIAEAVAAKHGLSLDELRSPTRKWRISHPRQEAYAACHAQQRGKQDAFSYAAIGRFFGRDHATVMWGVRQHQAREALKARRAALAAQFRGQA